MQKDIQEDMLGVKGSSAGSLGLTIDKLRFLYCFNVQSVPNGRKARDLRFDSVRFRHARIESRLAKWITSNLGVIARHRRDN